LWAQQRGKEVEGKASAQTTQGKERGKTSTTLGKFGREFFLRRRGIEVTRGKVLPFLGG